MDIPNGITILKDNLAEFFKCKMGISVNPIVLLLDISILEKWSNIWTRIFVYCNIFLK